MPLHPLAPHGSRRLSMPCLACSQSGGSDMEMQREVLRLIRHLIAPLMAFLVAKGWMPAYLQHDLAEVIIIVVSLVTVMAFSFRRDSKK